jgi:hypothetical protein
MPYMTKKIINDSDREELLRAIYKKYGTQKELAKALGIAEDSLSHKLKRLSNKFLMQLKELGIEVGSTVLSNIDSPHGTNIKGDKNKVLTGKEENVNYKELYYEQKEIVQMLREQIEFYRAKCKE